MGVTGSTKISVTPASLSGHSHSDQRDSPTTTTGHLRSQLPSNPRVSATEFPMSATRTAPPRSRCQPIASSAVVADTTSTISSAPCGPVPSPVRPGSLRCRSVANASRSPPDGSSTMIENTPRSSGTDSRDAPVLHQRVANLAVRCRCQYPAKSPRHSWPG
mgnify:CR=1 FL=1